MWLLKNAIQHNTRVRWISRPCHIPSVVNVILQSLPVTLRAVFEPTCCDGAMEAFIEHGRSLAEGESARPISMVNAIYFGRWVDQLPPRGRDPGKHAMNQGLCRIGEPDTQTVRGRWRCAFAGTTTRRKVYKPAVGYSCLACNRCNCMFALQLT